MSIKKEQYYLSIWQKVIDSLRASGNVSPEVLQSFFSTSYIESINQTNNSCKVIIVADNIINKSIVSQSDELISSCLIEILDLDCPVSIDIILESEIDTKPTFLSLINLTLYPKYSGVNPFSVHLLRRT